MSFEINGMKDAIEKEAICYANRNEHCIAFLNKRALTKKRAGCSTELHKFSFRFCNFPIFYVLNTREEKLLLSSGARGFFLQFYFSL